MATGGPRSYTARDEGRQVTETNLQLTVSLCNDHVIDPLLERCSVAQWLLVVDRKAVSAVVPPRDLSLYKCSESYSIQQGPANFAI